MKQVIADSMMSYLTGKVKYHKANVMVYLQNPVGIGEHPDIVEAIETQIHKIAEAEDKLFVCQEHFGFGSERKPDSGRG